jgi:hypothetical protein
MFRKTEKEINPAKLITPLGHPNPPEPHEIDAAELLARHYRTTVEFIIPIDDYKRKTADIKMMDAIWEIKSPKGNSKKNTIERQFKRGSKQSKNIVLDTRRTKLKDSDIEKTVLIEVKKRSSISKVIIINKNKIIIEIPK